MRSCASLIALSLALRAAANLLVRSAISVVNSVLRLSYSACWVGDRLTSRSDWLAVAGCWLAPSSPSCSPLSPLSVGPPAAVPSPFWVVGSSLYSLFKFCSTLGFSFCCITGSKNAPYCSAAISTPACLAASMRDCHSSSAICCNSSSGSIEGTASLWYFASADTTAGVISNPVTPLKASAASLAAVPSLMLRCKSCSPLG